MASTFSWATPASAAEVVPGTTSGLRNLANNTLVAGNAMDPGANPPLFASYRLESKYVTGSIAAGTVLVKCWFVTDPANEATPNYDDAVSLAGGTSAPSRAPDFIFIAGKALNNAKGYSQSIPAVVARPAHKFKVLAQNVAGLTFASVNDTDSLIKETTTNEYGS